MVWSAGLLDGAERKSTSNFIRASLALFCSRSTRRSRVPGHEVLGKRRRAADQPFDQHRAKNIEGDLCSCDEEPGGAGLWEGAVTPFRFAGGSRTRAPRDFSDHEPCEPRADWAINSAFRSSFPAMPGLF